MKMMEIETNKQTRKKEIDKNSSGFSAESTQRKVNKVCFHFHLNILKDNTHAHRSRTLIAASVIIIVDSFSLVNNALKVFAQTSSSLLANYSAKKKTTRKNNNVATSDYHRYG